MPAVRLARRRPALLYDIDWRTYTRLLRVFEERRGVRLTYDRGTLEIVSFLSLEHEGPTYLLGRFVDVLADEMSLPSRAGGSVTLRRRRKGRGLEPDGCYWIANCHRRQGKRTLDLRVDPPPDLAVEVDIPRHLLDRMRIYAALGVPEVWRLDNEGFAFHVLQGGAYQVRTHSLSFPQLMSADLAPFLAQWGQTDDTAIVRPFRDWVRQQLLTRPAAPPAP